MSNETMKKSLRDRAREMTALLPLMEGKDKGDISDLMGQISTITDYGFLPNDAGEAYAVFTVKERANKFYFGGSVLTARLSDLDAEGYHDDIVAEGLPVLFTETTSRKSKRKYTNVEFYPEG